MSIWPGQWNWTIATNRTSVSLAIIQFNWSGQVSIKSSDYCHLSLMPHTGSPSLRTHVVLSRNILSNQKNEIGKATFPFAWTEKQFGCQWKHHSSVCASAHFAHSPHTHVHTTAAPLTYFAFTSNLKGYTSDSLQSTGQEHLSYVTGES